MSDDKWRFRDYAYAFLLTALYFGGLFLLIEGFFQDIWNGRASSGLTWLEFAAGVSLMGVAIKLSYDKVYYDYYSDSD